MRKARRGFNKKKSDRIEGHRERRGERIAEYSDALKDFVEQLLVKLQEKGTIVSFRRHTKRDEFDWVENDFTVSRDLDRVYTERSFGIHLTIRSWNKAKEQGYRNRLCFPVGTKPETMEKRILELFDGGPKNKVEWDCKTCGASGAVEDTFKDRQDLGLAIYQMHQRLSPNCADGTFKNPS